jgi:anti-sigma-K factor RskA
MMQTAKLTLLVCALALACASDVLRAQSPTPIVVQAATSTTVPSKTSTAVVQDSETNQVALTMLQQMKAANEDILKKQEATLQRLDEIQKAAEQLKVFSKRG